MSQPAAPNIDGMTKQQLLDYAAEAGAVGLNGRMTKAQIIDALRG